MKNHRLRVRALVQVTSAAIAAVIDRPRGQRAHLMLIGLLPLLVSAGCQKAGADSEKQPVPVSIQAVELQAPDQAARYTASITPASQVETSFRIAGYVTRLHQVAGIDGRLRPLQAGDVVPRGTRLAELRSDEYSVKVTQAEAQLSEAQSAHAAANAQLREARAALDRAREELTRSKNLFETESITKRDYEAAQTQHEVGEARVQAVESQIAAIQAKLNGAQALVHEAQLARDDTLLVAPITGTVLKRLVEIGSFVGPGRPAFVIADTQSLRAAFGVPDLDLAQLRIGSSVSLTADAAPGRRFDGRVISISPAADPRTRIFDVEVALVNQDRLLRIGMICSLTLAGQKNPARLPVIPINSVVRSKSDPGKYAVFVVEADAAKKVCRMREVSLGETYGNRVAVTQGLSSGEQVVTAGSTVVQDGDTVQVVAW